MVTLMAWEQDLIVNDVSPPQRGQISLLIFDSDRLSISSLIFNLHTLAIVGGHNLGLEWLTLDKKMDFTSARFDWNGGLCDTY